MTAALDRLVHHLGVPAAKALAELEVFVVEERPPKVGELAEEGEVLDVGRDEHLEAARRVPVLAALAPLPARDEVPHAVDGALVVEQVGLAAPGLVQKAALARARLGRDVHRQEGQAVPEEVRRDVACRFVQLGREVQVLAVLEEGSVVPRVEVRRRLLRRRVLRAVQRVVDTEDVVLRRGVARRRACRRDGRVVPRLVDQSRLCRSVLVEAREERVRPCGEEGISVSSFKETGATYP